MADDLNKLVKKIRARTVKKRITEKVGAAFHTFIAERIFAKGQDATGAQIGTYSKGYQAQRRRGVIYPKKGQKRNVSYPISTKVILQATQQMKNDFDFIVLPNGNIGSGFKNDYNFKKSEWVENTYNKEIFDLSEKEKRLFAELIDKEIQKYLDGI